MAQAARNFNPRSPRGGATLKPGRLLSFHCIFQSTLPTRGSDSSTAVVNSLCFSISIHAPHEGERRAMHIKFQTICTISIHAPHEGERLASREKNKSIIRFQSTLPTRGSDIDNMVNNGLVFISIHAPHEGERQKLLACCTSKLDFNPRSPRGGATQEL